MIGFTLLGGYLGVGKTTLLNQILRHNDGRRLALLVNDFGAINIDSDLIESRDEQQINLANGCVCCSLSDGFFEALETLRGLEPTVEHILVEASGVADVGKLAQYGHTPGLRLDGVIVLVDAESVRRQAQDKYIGTTIMRQLRAADLLVVNKTDLVTPEALAATQHWLGEQVPGAQQVPTVRAELPLAVVLGTTHIATKAEPIAGHEHYTSWSYAHDGPTTQTQVDAFLKGLESSAGILRAKGWFALASGHSLEVQVVGPRCEVTSRRNAAALANCRFVVIGLANQLAVQELENLAQQTFN